ncbi:hypothetical protein [Azospirillum brasilense]|uniref:hypothetical protein n=1 Tax=Azospirillum brasilense TaxID=192 RepID=UPI003AF68E8B
MERPLENDSKALHWNERAAYRHRGDLSREGKVTVSRSLSVDEDRITIPTLIGALFHDLSPDKEPRIPMLGEKRELQQLVHRGRKPVALFVDEAHDLHGKTLIGWKRLMDVITDGGGMLSVVLVGHPTSCATTHGGRPWKRSATAPSSSSSTVWPITRFPTSADCSRPARPKASGSAT